MAIGDAMICGPIGRFQRHLQHVDQIIGKAPGVKDYGTLSALILTQGPLFLADTYVTYDPSAEQLANMTMMAAEEVSAFWHEPKIALRVAFEFRQRRYAVVGEDAASAAPAEAARRRTSKPRARCMPMRPFRRSFARRSSRTARLKGAANLLVMPSLDAANIAFNLLKAVSSGVAVSPILLGAAKPAHIVTPSITVRGLLNMAALAVVDCEKGATASR